MNHPAPYRVQQHETQDKESDSAPAYRQPNAATKCALTQQDQHDNMRQYQEHSPWRRRFVLHRVVLSHPHQASQYRNARQPSHYPEKAPLLGGQRR